MILRKTLFAASLALSVVAGAVAPTKSNIGGSYVHFVPSAFGYDGKPSFFVFDSDNTSESVIRVDENLEAVETFTLPSVEYSITTDILIPSGFKTGKEFTQSDRYSSIPLTDAVRLVAGLYPAGYISVNMSPSYGSNPDRELKLFIPGNSIPEGVYANITENEFFYRVQQGEAMTDVNGFAIYDSEGSILEIYSAKDVCNGVLDWDTDLKVHSTKTQNESLGFFDEIYFMDEKHERQLNITQTLFNSDKDYEILVPVIKNSGKTITVNKNSGWSTIEYTYEGPDGPETATTSQWVEKIHAPEYAGVGVVNVQTGETLVTYEFPEPYAISDDNHLYFSNPCIYSFGDKLYLEIEVPKNSDEDNDYSYEENIYYYEITRNQSGVKAPAMTTTVKVHPSILNRGENLEVSVGDNDEISAITLTGINGRTEQRVAGNDGRQTYVKTNGLNSGVHIVGVTTANGKTHSQKIIVK